MIKSSAKDIDQKIKNNLGKLRKTGVLTVRPGYEITNHMLTGRAAIVATVHTKKLKNALDKNDVLPDKISGVPVDVREASAYQRLRASDAGAAAIVKSYGRPENKQPEWDFEREMPSGKLLAQPDSDTQLALAKARKSQPSTDRALKFRETKPQVPGGYKPPANAPLTPLVVTGKITAHVSPDAGLKTLRTFLQGTQQSLTIGMYDFTSGPLLSAFLDLFKSNKTLQMVLDNPAPNDTRNQSDWTTVSDLNQAMGGRATIARALTKNDRFASNWLFPSAYHIKVVVRDGTAVWISSGNLNNSNQPDLTSTPSTLDRDWHLIVEDVGLAQLFKAYLDNDYAAAKSCQAPDPADIEEAIRNAENQNSREENPPVKSHATPPANPVQPQTFMGNITVTPLLTPDMQNGKSEYYSHIMDLISKAQQSIWIQLQYIEASPDTTGDYAKLLQSLADKAQNGVQVRLIVSAAYAEKNGEKMMATGVNIVDLIHTQLSVHNKGFVFDGKSVIVSSQNFSPQGIEQNRDAGLIVESPQIANYFGKVFDRDWSGSKLLKLPAGGSRTTNRSSVPGKNGSSPKGKVRQAKQKSAKPGKTTAKRSRR